MKPWMLLWGLLPLFNTLYQLCMKMMAENLQGKTFGAAWLESALSTPWLWLALVSEIAAFIVWMRILADCNLSKAFPLTAISYVLVLCIGWFIFDEEMLLLQWLGGALILTGIGFIATAETLTGDHA